MSGSIIVSGAASFSKTAPSGLMASSPVAQTVSNTISISCQGTKPGGDAPYWQTIAISATAPTTLPANSITGASPFRDGQRLTVLNAGAQPITIPANGLNPGSQVETIEPKQMIELMFKTPIGWLPLDDDAGFKMPVMFANQDLIADGASQRMLVTDKGTRVRNGNLTEPVARLQTTSFAARSRKVGAGTNITYEDFTVILDDTQPGTFILPDPKTCVDRCLNLVTLKSAIVLSIVGGTKARAGNADYLQVPAGGAAMLQSVGDSTSAQWFRVGGF
jgi:hypothetical protein